MKFKATIFEIFESFVKYKYARLLLGVSLFLLFSAIFPQKIVLVLYLLPIYLAIKRYEIINDKKLREEIISFADISELLKRLAKETLRPETEKIYNPNANRFDITLVSERKNKKNIIFHFPYLSKSFIPLVIYVINLFISQQIINNLLVIIASILSIVLLFEFIVIFVMKLIRDENVSYEIIVGSISIYILLGILWFFMYLIIFLLDGNAFSSFGFKKVEQPFDLLYLSFKTLTTVGYGDIVPMSSIAKIITNFEAIIGVIFPAVFIARLVGNLKSK